jgi:hypothetical protein
VLLVVRHDELPKSIIVVDRERIRRRLPIQSALKEVSAFLVTYLARDVSDL